VASPTLRVEGSDGIRVPLHGVAVLHDHVQIWHCDLLIDPVIRTVCCRLPDRQRAPSLRSLQMNS
jgi:hypothetical protein